MSDMPHPSDTSADKAQSSTQTDDYQNALRDVEQAREALRQAQERLDKTQPAPPTGQPVVPQQPYYYQAYSQQTYQQPYQQQSTGTYQPPTTAQQPPMTQPPVQPPVQPHYAAPYVSPKDHVAAGLLAIFLGFLGIHKFYLGYNVQGFIMLAISVVGGPLLFGLPFGVMWVIAIIEGVIYLSKNQTDFERMYVYNKQEWF